MNSNDQARQRKLLMAKALGFTTTISKWSQEERQNKPSPAYARDFNELRAHIETLHPELNGLLPPEATLRNYDSVDAQTFGEIQGWADQFYQLLAVLGDESL